jgi:hypothetical protein
MIPVQGYLRGSGTKPGILNSSDSLTAAVWRSGQTVSVFTLPITWYTANSTQVGYLQGQVEVTLSTANAILLTPGVSYTLLCWRAISGTPTELECISRIPLIIEPIPV